MKFTKNIGFLLLAIYLIARRPGGDGVYPL